MLCVNGIADYDEHDRDPHNNCLQEILHCHKYSSVECDLVIGAVRSWPIQNNEKLTPLTSWTRWSSGDRMSPSSSESETSATFLQQWFSGAEKQQNALIYHDVYDE